MNYRIAQLLSPEDLGPAGTKTIDIDLDQPISRLEIRFKVTKGLDYMTAPGPANLTKIELVDGSEVLHSLTGYENQALAYYNRPGVLMGHGQELTGNSEMNLFAIDFGRHLWDTQLAFLPGRFRNPQLKITYDEDVSDTSATVNEMEVLAHIFDEKQVSPIGFLRAIEEYSYTLGADNSYETIKLSEDLVIRQILVRAYQDAYEPWYSIDEARLDENNLQRIPFDFTSLEKYFRMMKGTWPIIVYPFQGRAAAAGKVFYVPMTQYWAGPQAQQQSGSAVPYFNAANTRGGKLTALAASTVDIDALASGWLPWHCYQFPMGMQQEIDDWYNPSGKSPRLRLRASTGATSSTGQVILEQLRRY